MDEDAIAKAVKVAAGPPGCWTPTGFDTPWQSSHSWESYDNLSVVQQLGLVREE